MNYIITNKDDLITGFVGIGGKPTQTEDNSVYEIFYGDIPPQAVSNLGCYKYNGSEFTKLSKSEMFQYYVEAVRSIKIESMSSICNRVITDGISIGEDHYSLSVEDQINITRLGLKADDPNNSDKLLYHADGQSLRIYTKEEMSLIYHRSMAWVDYNTIYFNLLKQVLTTLESAEDIMSIMYNNELPPGYKDQLLELIDVSEYNFSFPIIMDNANYDDIVPVIDATSSIELYKKEMAKKEEETKNQLYGKDI